MVTETLKMLFLSTFPYKEFTIDQILDVFNISRPTSLELIRELIEDGEVKEILKPGKKKWYLYHAAKN